MVYNKTICREILLPNLFNADYSVQLSRQEYALSSDVTLRFENTPSGWKICGSREYRIIHKRNVMKEWFLKNEDLLELEFTSGDSVLVLSSDTPLFFRVMEKYDLTGISRITIGKSPDNMICYDFMGLISAAHAEMVRTADGWIIADRSANGVFLNGKAVKGRAKLTAGDTIHIFGLRLICMGDILLAGSNCGTLKVNTEQLVPYEIEPVKEQEDDMTEREEHFFNRSPRDFPVLYKDPVQIEEPPAPKTQKQKPTYMVIGPAFTMAIPMAAGTIITIIASQSAGRSSGAFMYTGLITAFGSAIIGVIWALLNLNYAKKEAVEEETARFNAYSSYLMDITNRLRGQYTHNSEAMNRLYPSASECLNYNENSTELWNRNMSHSDFLFARLGIGDSPFQAEIQIPKDKFSMTNDSLKTRPKMIRDEFSTLHNVPVGIDLMKNQLVGIVGGEGKTGAVSLMHAMAAGLAASHSYTDVKFVLIYNDEEKDMLYDWECMRWFPHVWSEDKTFRYMAGNETEIRDVFFELSNILRTRSENASAPGTKQTVVRPHYVLFVSDPAILEGELLTKYIYQPVPEYGITTILMSETLDQLPNSCETIIQNDGHGSCLYSLSEMENNKKQSFVPDTVSARNLENFGMTLSNIRVREVETTTEIPNNLTFFEMYNVKSLPELNVLDRWRKNRSYNSMKALVGRKAGNADCYLDIHEKFHGPHGLIAGTTGSGKSETLQTYMLSLAVNFSPEDVAFFIIDFKGGGMANLFAGLPHLAGQISNLSGNQIQRAMISIRSERDRRERIFAQYGVHKIDLYTRLYKNHEAVIPIPHLFIIIDEFAELKREQPEFMQELISISQVGRSLGIHLILSTQKPSGTVDDNIWSNSKFHLCLRVQDRQDSMDMLHKPDAAFLTQAGRCYLQVGNDELYELFQSGYSGAPYSEDMSSDFSAAAMINRTGRTELIGSRYTGRQNLPADSQVKQKTQLNAVIEYLAQIAKENHYAASTQLWLPVLPGEIYLEDIDPKPQKTEKFSLDAVTGMYDDPEKQIQKPLSVNFTENGHLAVCGAVVSGKSTFLQTMVYSFLRKYSPKELQMYLIDFSAHKLVPFENAPGVGGVITDEQEDKLSKFINMLNQMMDERKALLRGGNFLQYVQAYGMKMPAVIVVLDNYESFREKTADKYADTILKLVREGVGYGIWFVVTAMGFGLTAIPSRIGDNIRTVISLEQQDKYKYMDVMRAGRIDLMPETNVKGRGLASVSDRILEFQTALSLKADDDFSRSQKLEVFAEKLSAQWHGERARKIPEIPENPVYEQLAELPEYRSAVTSKDLLPIGWKQKDASVFSFQLSQNYCFTISGKARIGKTNALKLMIAAAYLKKAEIVVIEKDTSGFAELKKICSECGGTYISSSAELYSYFQSLIPEFKKRNIHKRELLQNGYDEAAVAAEMQASHHPVFIMIADMNDFMTMVYKPDEGVGAMSGFLENITEKGSLHNIYFAAVIKNEYQNILTGYRAYNYFTAARKGIHLGGMLSQQKIFNFQNLSFADQNKVTKKGIGLASDDTEEGIGIEVVLPLMRMKS